MKVLPLLREHPRPVQFVLAVVVPALYGGLTGYFLGVSEPVYLVLSIIGIVGAVGAGFDHLGAKAGAGRGIIAGSVFGASILIAHEIHGAAATAHLPEPAILLVAVTTVLAVAFAALGGRLRERVMKKEDAAAAIGVAESSEINRSAPPTSEPAPALRSSQAGASFPRGEDTTSAGPAAAPVPATATTNGSVSLNSGSFEDYRALGLSVTLSQRIVSYRDRLQGYSSVEDLDQVPGFSKAALAELKQRVTV